MTFNTTNTLHEGPKIYDVPLVVDGQVVPDKRMVVRAYSYNQIIKHFKVDFLSIFRTGFIGSTKKGWKMPPEGEIIDITGDKHE